MSPNGKRLLLIGVAVSAAAAAALFGYCRWEKHSSQQEARNALASGRVASVVSFLDRVDLYQKNGLVEVYGGQLDAFRDGPVTIRGTLLEPKTEEQWLIWTPDASVPAVVTHLSLRFRASLDEGDLAIGFVTKKGKVVRWETRLGPRTANAPATAWDSVRRKQYLSGKTLTLARNGEWLTGVVPERVLAEVRQGSIAEWFVELSGASRGQSVRLEAAALHNGPSLPKEPLLTRVTGNVLGGKENQPGQIVLLRENGERLSALVASDGSFHFDNVPADRALSLRFAEEERDRYADAGRWFFATDSITPTIIRVEPQYTNVDGHPIHLKDVSLPGPDEVFAFPRYRPQTRIRWPGTPAVQEFYRELEPLRSETSPLRQEFLGITFTNSIGFVDRERHATNRDGCLRIAHAGGSSSVALQVRPFEKFNLMLESELGVRLGRCVEVISAGRDNGDPGAVYPAVRDYLLQFGPDLVVLEYMQLLGLQMERTLLQKLHGWDFDYSPLDHFSVGGNGKAVFAPSDPSWPLSVQKPERGPLTPGVPLLQTLSVPQLSAAGKAAFRNLGAVLSFYKSKLGKIPLALQTGGDQARCETARTCGPGLVWPDQRTVEGDVRVFLKNVGRVCAKTGVLCLQPDIPAAGTDRERLTYVDDGHYTVRGHQWLAKALAEQLEPIVRKRSGGP